ncbi:MAG: hypothetical protein IPL84_13810 [Chitinophagaceae bacterium]|nr:hypothetical protein [Chitinophagaceae bacterium]
MSKTKLLSIAVIGLMVINIGIVGFLLIKKPPMPPGGRPPMPEAGPKKIIAERLDFDKEQVAAFEKLVEAHQTSVKALGDSIKIAKNNLFLTLQSETFAGKDSLVNLLGALQKQMELLHYQHFTDLKKICRPDQLNRYNDLTSELASFFGAGKNGPPPPQH